MLLRHIIFIPMGLTVTFRYQIADWFSFSKIFEKNNEVNVLIFWSLWHQRGLEANTKLCHNITFITSTVISSLRLIKIKYTIQLIHSIVRFKQVL